MPGHGRRRGRCRGRRWVDNMPEPTHFRPEGYENIPKQFINLTIVELEALRLVDLEDLTQEEAAVMMGVSRKTLWNDLQKARKKVITALVNGYPINIQGGNCIPRKTRR